MNKDWQAARAREEGKIAVMGALRLIRGIYANMIAEDAAVLVRRSFRKVGFPPGKKKT